MQSIESFACILQARYPKSQNKLYCRQRNLHPEPFFDITKMGLCEEVAGLHPNIQAAVIIRRLEVKERFVNKVVPIPPEEELAKLFFRAEISVSMTKESDNLFGSTGYVFTNHDTLDTFMFPLKDGILIVPVFKPYNHEDLADRILKLLSVFP